MVLKKFERYILSYVLAGSLTQGIATATSDIDVWIVIDDTDGSKEKGTLAIDELYSSSRAQTYLYRFHKGTKDTYAYWTSDGSKDLLLYLAGAGRIREKRFGKSNVIKESGNGYYRVQSQKAVKFLQTL